MASSGSALVIIPEGIVSVGGTLRGLGTGSDTATEVEDFVAKITPFDE